MRRLVKASLLCHGGDRATLTGVDGKRASARCPHPASAAATIAITRSSAFLDLACERQVVRAADGKERRLLYRVVVQRRMSVTRALLGNKKPRDLRGFSTSG